MTDQTQRQIVTERVEALLKRLKSSDKPALTEDEIQDAKQILKVPGKKSVGKVGCYSGF